MTLDLVLLGDYLELRDREHHTHLLQQQAARIQSLSYLVHILLPHFEHELDGMQKEDQERARSAVQRGLRSRKHDLGDIAKIVEARTEQEAYACYWPRDAIVQLKDTPLTSGGADILAEHYFPNTHAHESLFAIGGHFIHVQNLTITAADIAPSTLQRTLSRYGMTPHIMPSPLHDPVYRAGACALELRMRKSDGHIDTELGIVHSPEGALILLATELYNAVYPEAVQDLATKLDARIIIAPETEQVCYPVNLLQLPRGEVLVPERATYVAQRLREALGVRTVHTVPTDPRYNTDYGGGLRCRTQILCGLEQSTIDEAFST